MTPSDFSSTRGTPSKSSAPTLRLSSPWRDNDTITKILQEASNGAREDLKSDIDQCLQVVDRIPFYASESEANTDASLNRYQVIEILGIGGFGIVVRALDRQLQRDVAIKVLRPSLLRSKAIRSRFQLEAEALARCSVKGVVPIHGVGVCDEIPYIVMGLIQGPTLHALLKEQTEPWSPRMCARLLADVAKAVHGAHQKGFLHRDLKPSNVILAASSESIDCPWTPFVTDFGLAKDLQPNPDRERSFQSFDTPLIGTVKYMSPEQATGDMASIGIGSDIFTLGVILYEMLTLRCPFVGRSNFETVAQIVHMHEHSTRHWNPMIPRDLDAIVRKCLAKSVSQRYNSAGELAEDLERYLSGKPTHARPVGAFQASWRWARRNPALAAVSAVLLMTCAMGTPLLAILYSRNVLYSQKLEQSNRRSERSTQLAMQAMEDIRYAADEILRGVPQANEKRLELQQKAFSICQDLAEQRQYDDESLYRLSVLHHLVATAAGQNGEYELEFHHRRECIGILNRLAQKQPLNPKIQFDLFTSYFWFPQKDLELEAIRTHRMTALEHLKVARSLDPNNVDYEEAYAAILCRIGEIESSTDIDAAKEWLDQAIVVSNQLGNSNPQRPTYFKHAFCAKLQLARNDLSQQRWNEAVEQCDEAEKVFEKFQLRGDANDVLMKNMQLEWIRGHAYREIHPAKSIVYLRRHVNLTEKLEKQEKSYEQFRIDRVDSYVQMCALSLQLGKTVQAKNFLDLANSTWNLCERTESHASRLELLHQQLVQLDTEIRNQPNALGTDSTITINRSR